MQLCLFPDVCSQVNRNANLRHFHPFSSISDTAIVEFVGAYDGLATVSDAEILECRTAQTLPSLIFGPTGYGFI